MSQSQHQTITIYWYDPDHTKKNPKDWAFACRGELSALMNEFALIRDSLYSTSRKRDLQERVRLCRYHHENYLLRTYSLRERVWDILAILTKEVRKSTGTKSFRNQVLAVLQKDFPQVTTAFDKLMALVERDIESRNIATHRTFLLLGLLWGGQVFDVDDLVIQIDPSEPKDAEILRLVRDAFRRYTREQCAHIQEIIEAIMDFAVVCDDPIDALRG